VEQGSRRVRALAAGEEHRDQHVHRGGVDERAARHRDATPLLRPSSATVGFMAVVDPAPVPARSCELRCRGSRQHAVRSSPPGFGAVHAIFASFTPDL
jgi:hypothetical protein